MKKAVWNLSRRLESGFVMMGFFLLYLTVPVNLFSCRRPSFDERIPAPFLLGGYGLRAFRKGIAWVFLLIVGESVSISGKSFLHNC